MDAQRPRSDVDRRAAEDARRARRGAVTDPAVVMEAAARFLAARSRSVAETRRRLLRLGYQAPLVEEVLRRLVAMRHLDDAAFARAWMESRDRSRPRGTVVLRQELRRQGIDDDVIREALDDRVACAQGGWSELPGTEDGAGGSASAGDAATSSADRAAAERLLRRRAAALAREPDARTRHRRAYALLARNGFDPAICREVSAAVAGPEAPVDPMDEGPDPDAWQTD